MERDAYDGDQEIQGDAEQDWIEQQRTEALEAGEPEPHDYTDEELDDMWNAYMQHQDDMGL